MDLGTQEEQAVALVTGTNKGIGREIAQQLAALGMAVLLGSLELEEFSPRARAKRDQILGAAQRLFQSAERRKEGDGPTAKVG